MEGKITELKTKLTKYLKNWVRLTQNEDIPLGIEGIDFDESFEQEEQDLKIIHKDLDLGCREDC